MKTGLMAYKAKTAYKNIGDYVQGVAAAQYTGYDDVVFVEREYLNSYDGDPIKLIMNGWYMHLPENWPPSDKVKPLLFSMHMTPNIGERMLTEEGIAYFKKHGPVGCRDKGTERLLKSKGIPCYFSGCLTLTLGRTFKNKHDGDKVYFVDPYFEPISKDPVSLLGYLSTLLANYSTVKSIAKRLNKSTSFKTLIKTASFFATYSQWFDKDVLRDAEYLTHRIKESTLGNTEIGKFRYAEDLLTKYSKAKLVVTSRIHVALPCIGMDTPVIFVMNEHFNQKPTSKGRFDGLIELFNVMDYSNFTLKPIMGFEFKKFGKNDSVRNKQKHHEIAAALEKSALEFMQQN